MANDYIYIVAESRMLNLIPNAKLCLFASLFMQNFKTYYLLPCLFQQSRLDVNQPFLDDS